MARLSPSRGSKRRVFTTPEMITWLGSTECTRSIGKKIRRSANSSTTRPFTRGARLPGRFCNTTSRTLPTWSPVASSIGSPLMRETKIDEVEATGGG